MPKQRVLRLENPQGDMSNANVVRSGTEGTGGCQNFSEKLLPS